MTNSTNPRVYTTSEKKLPVVRGVKPAGLGLVPISSFSVLWVVTEILSLATSSPNPRLLCKVVHLP
jgi:hypothetical protein